MKSDKIIQLESNRILIGMIELENLYDCTNHFNNKNLVKEVSKMILPFNMNPKGEKQEVLIGMSCTLDEREELIKVFKTFKSVFSWNYYDLKGFKKDIFQHIIPLKENTKPFRQKPRHFNP